MSKLKFKPEKSYMKQLKAYRPYAQKFMWMSPEMFLKLVEGTTKISPSAYSRETVEMLKELLKRGKRIPPLWIDVDIKKKRVWRHEGRHRALASYVLGIEKIPVFIYFWESGYPIHLEDVKRIPKLNEIRSQFS